MEHAKKMVLIPSETVDRLRDKITAAGHPFHGNNEASNRVENNPISRLDGEMRAILDAPTKDDAEKWKLYQQILHRFLVFAEDSRKPLRLDLHTHQDNNASKKQNGSSSDNQQELTDAPVDNQRVVSRIVSSVPKKYQSKAELLLDHLGEASSRFTWDNNGVVSIDGSAIAGSNIVDLVNDTVRSRKGFHPNGRQAFARFLQTINTPREYIGNPSVWKSGQAQSSPLVVSTPVASGSKRRKTPYSRDDAGNSSIEYSAKEHSGVDYGGDDSFSPAKSRQELPTPGRTLQRAAKSNWLSFSLRK